MHTPVLVPIKKFYAHVYGMEPFLGMEKRSHPEEMDGNGIAGFQILELSS
jgi:hypothetical protein